MLRADSETTEAIAPRAAESLIGLARDAFAAADAVVLSDYAKGVLTPDLVQRLIEAAHGAGRPVVVDPKGRDYGRYAGATVLTPNRAELAHAAGEGLESDDAIVAACRTLIDRHAFGAILVTRSRDGMTLVSAEGTVAHLAAEAREVFDVSGAGDTVVATLAAALGQGVALTACAQLANAAAGVAVGKAGTAAVRAADLLHAVRAGDLSASEAKIMPLAAALDAVAGWRARGQRIGFTNGCFDLLHPGHVSLLRQAHQAADRLIVGLNSDASVRRLKGADRPVQSEAARAQVLASLETVDLGGRLRRGHAGAPDRGFPPRLPGQGLRLHGRPGGGRRDRAGLWRHRADRRKRARPQHHRHHRAPARLRLCQMWEDARRR